MLIRIRFMSSTEGDGFTFQGEAQVGPGVISTLLKVDAWASAIKCPSIVSPRSTACDVIEQLAQRLICGATGFEKLLLLKSLQEAFLYCLDLHTDFTPDEI